MSSSKDISARTEDDDPWFHNGSTEMADILPVEVLLVQGRWPEMSDRIWRSDELKVAFQVVKKPTMSRGSGKRKQSSGLKQPVVEGWECRSYVLKHNAIGGVTNQLYLVRWRVKKGSTKPVFSSPPNPSNCTLKHCLAGATLEGVRVTEPPENKINTEKGLIMRDHLEKDVVVELVYHSWVKRKLSTQERANVPCVYIVYGSVYIYGSKA
jgi:hypothetical protein